MVVSSGTIGLIANTNTASAKTAPIAGRSAPINRSSVADPSVGSLTSNVPEVCRHMTLTAAPSAPAIATRTV